MSAHRRVLVIEENTPHGALGSRVKEIAWDTRAACDLRCHALQDAFIHFYGTYEEILEKHGLSAEAILADLAR